MAVPGHLDCHLSVYALACRAFAERLDELARILQCDTRLSVDDCVARFEEELRFYFQNVPNCGIEQSVDLLASRLHSQAVVLRARNSQVGGVLDEIVEIVGGQASPGKFAADLGEFHNTGRELARRFFGDSPWPETQTLLTRDCELVLEHGMPDDNDKIAGLAERFGFRAAPLAYYDRRYNAEAEQYEHDLVVARHTATQSFALYLAYPFLFLHEYTGHVYAGDSHNERINDGWMLHAADAFLTREQRLNPEVTGLNSAQVGAFRDKLLPALSAIPRRACCFTREFDGWLDCYGEGAKFRGLTFELAAFRSNSREGPEWPTRFVNSLENEFRADPKRLLRIIREAGNAREILASLNPV